MFCFRPLIERQRRGHHGGMRLLVGGVAAAVFAGALAACAAIAGLGPYSSENCGDQGCDASVHPKPGDEHVDTDDMGMVGDDVDASSRGRRGHGRRGRLRRGADHVRRRLRQSDFGLELRQLRQPLHGRRRPLLARRRRVVRVRGDLSGQCAYRVRQQVHGHHLGSRTTAARAARSAAWGRPARAPSVPGTRRPTGESRVPTADARPRRPPGSRPARSESATARPERAAPRAAASAPRTPTARATSASRLPARTTSRAAGPTARAPGAAMASTASSQARASRRSARARRTRARPAAGSRTRRSRAIRRTPTATARRTASAPAASAFPARTTTTAPAAREREQRTIAAARPRR